MFDASSNRLQVLQVVHDLWNGWSCTKIRSAAKTAPLHLGHPSLAPPRSYLWLLKHTITSYAENIPGLSMFVSEGTWYFTPTGPKFLK